MALLGPIHLNELAGFLSGPESAMWFQPEKVNLAGPDWCLGFFCCLFSTMGGVSDALNMEGSCSCLWLRAQKLLDVEAL